jgi:anti-anti-sigma factor
MTPAATPLVYAFPPAVTTEAAVAIERELGGLLGPTSTALVIDLGRTRFLSSGGLGLLVRVGKSLAERGGGVAVARAHGPVVRLLRAVGLDAVIPAFGDLDAATAHFARPSEQ